MKNNDNDLIFAGERLDDLEFGGQKIIQHPDEYCFSSDAVLLANLTTAGASVCDLCSGSGIIATIIAGKSSAQKIVGVELQPTVAARAQRSVKYNNLEKRVQIVCADVSDAPQLFGKGTFDTVVCNPPYFKRGEGEEKLAEAIAISRHEIKLTLDDVCRAAAELLRFGGKFFMVHKTSRMAEVIKKLCAVGLEPKKITLIYPKSTKAADTFVVEAKSGAKAGLILKSLIVYKKDNTMTAAAKKIYCKE